MTLYLKLKMLFSFVRRQVRLFNHVSTNFCSLKHIKYWRCTWHSADFLTTAALNLNGAENIFIWQTWKLAPPPINTPGLTLKSVIYTASENINPVSDYSGSAAGQATWQWSHATCRIWSQILLPHCCSLTEPTCWPPHIKTKLQCAYSWEM